MKDDFIDYTKDQGPLGEITYDLYFKSFDYRCVFVCLFISIFEINIVGV